MTVSHNYLADTLTKPTAAETTEHELVINEADGLLYTKTSTGEVISVGGSGGGGGGSAVIGSQLNMPSTLENAPAGCVWADGQELSRVAYADLYRFAVDNDLMVTDVVWLARQTESPNDVVTVYSLGDGVDTFRIPNLKDFVRAAVGDEVDLDMGFQDQIQNIAANWSSAVSPGFEASGAVEVASGAPYNGNVFTGAGEYGFTFDASRVARTGDETHPTGYYTRVAIVAIGAVGDDSQDPMVGARGIVVEAGTVGDVNYEIFADGTIHQWATVLTVEGALLVHLPRDTSTVESVVSTQVVGGGANDWTSNYEFSSSLAINIHTSLAGAPTGGNVQFDIWEYTPQIGAVPPITDGYVTVDTVQTITAQKTFEVGNGTATDWASQPVVLQGGAGVPAGMAFHKSDALIAEVIYLNDAGELRSTQTIKSDQFRAWQDVTVSRSAEVNYYNDTGNDIQVSIGGTTQATDGGVSIIALGGVTCANTSWGNATGNNPWHLTVTIPPNGTYLLSNPQLASITNWAELR